MEFLSTIGLAFLPLLVAIDPFGLVPIFVGLTSGLDPARVRQTIHQAMVTSLAISVIFALVGVWIMGRLSVDIQDFQIGGGLLLFAYAVVDILATGRRLQQDRESLGIVPLATPLIAGPALLTTIILMIGRYGMTATLAALVLNLLLTWVALLAAGWLVVHLGKEIMSGVSKVMMILLAGVGVMMVRQGIMFYVTQAAGR